VDITKNDFSDIRILIHQLRVPELNYLMAFSTDDDNNQASTLGEQVLKGLIEPTESTLLKQILKSDRHRSLPPEINNLAFLTDRIFDVWSRKNQLPDMLNAMVSVWRFPFFRILIDEFCDKQRDENTFRCLPAISEFIDLLESLSEKTIGWDEYPKRSRHILVDFLTNINSILLSDRTPSLDTLIAQSSSWVGFCDKQQQKFDKVVERLVSLEAKKNDTSYSIWLARHYVNGIFEGRRIPESLQQFIELYWLNAIASSFEKAHSAILDTNIDKLTKNLILIFCHKTDASFSLADHILDDLQLVFESLNVAVEDSAWFDIEHSLVQKLQGNSTESVSNYQKIEEDTAPVSLFGDFDKKILFSKDIEVPDAEAGHWYKLVNDQTGAMSPVRLASKCSFSQQLLFCNYLGMKAAQFSFDNYFEYTRNGMLKAFDVQSSFAQVLKVTIKGLLKVSDTQKKARIAAAEKAKSEAEALLAERQRAEDFAKKKAEEIAEQTRRLLDKRAEKLRIEKENEVLSTLHQFCVGAWISINVNGEKSRYRLVVKLAATGKYIFVDKLGIKKREYYEADLVQAMLSEDIEVLSDGAEFEDSLERVVSRLRMSK